MLHVFITRGRFRRCHELGLYGVRPLSLNQLALVQEGHEVFFYEWQERAFYGPYLARGPVSHAGGEVPFPLWTPPAAGRETFRYVVGVSAPAPPRRIPSADFRRLAASAGARVSAADFANRSVFTFLSADGAVMSAVLGEWARAEPPAPLAAPGVVPLDLFNPVTTSSLPSLLETEAMSEALLEFLLAREPSSLADDLGARPVFNQLRIDARGDRIDLLFANHKHLFVVELKTTRRNAEARRDITRYELWVRGKRDELVARLGTPSRARFVTPVLVAQGGAARPEGCRIYDWSLSSNRTLTFARVQ